MGIRKIIAYSVATAMTMVVNGIATTAQAICTGESSKKISREEYSIVILGDTHFDTEPASVYHSDYNEPVEWLNRVQRAEFSRNGEMWRERCPRMVDRAASLVASDTRMVFQMGDLIQGDCGNPEVHKKMLEDVMDSFKSKLGGLPFVTVCGNHDIRGTKAGEAYNEFMPERISKEIGKEVSKTTFSFMIGPDVYIFIDFSRRDTDEIEKLLKQTKGARYTFIVTHAPVFPSDEANCRWFLYGRDKYTDIRRHFRKLFAERNAIVLCGHTHTVELADWFGDGGRITQMTMNSVWSREDLCRFSVRAQDSAMYGELRKSELNADGTPIKDETTLFDEYRPGLKRYLKAEGAGSFKMTVSGSGIVVDFYGGDSEKITKPFVLR